MSCGIYKIENLINHKCYIGQSINIEKRWYDHKHSIDNFAIHSAMKKYGIENFSFEIVEECNEKDLDKKECFWIQEFNSLVPNGYNMVEGGSNGAALARRIPVFQYDLNGNFIAEYPGINEAARINHISGTAIGHCCKKIRTTAGGYFWSFLKNDNFSKENIKDHRSCKIIQYDMLGNELARYNSAKEAAQAVNGSPCAITKACRGGSKTSKGFQWRYDIDDENIPCIIKAGIKKPVSQWSLDNNLIKNYESITMASKETGITLSTIAEAANGKRKTAGGYIWKFNNKSPIVYSLTNKGIEVNLEAE